MPVHLTGKTVNMVKVMEIALKHKLVVIEDAAQAFGAEMDNGMAGGVGDFGCFSFYPFKILGCPGDGGMITTNNEEYYQKLLLLRNHGNASQTGMEVGAKGRIREGWNSRLDNLHAGILDARFDLVGEILSRRDEIAWMYDEGLADIQEVNLPTQQDGRVYQEYVIQVADRQDFVAHLKEKGIEVLPNLTQITSGLKSNHIIWQPDLELPMTDHFTQSNVRLPIWPTLTDEQIQYVIKTIKDYYAD